MSLVEVSLASIKHRRTRSWLTVMGIVIGIAAVVSLVSITWGMEAAIVGQLESFGFDKIGIMPGGNPFEGPPGQAAYQQGNIKLTDDDVDFIEKINGVKDVASFYIQGAQVEYGRQSIFITIYGMDTEGGNVLSDIQGFEIESGRELKETDKGKAVVGSVTANERFDKDIRVGSKLDIDGKRVEVVGVLKRTGDPDTDSSVMVSLDEARDLFDVGDEVSFIWLTVRENKDPEVVGELIEKRLEDYRGTKDFAVFTAEQTLEAVGSILGVLQIVLVGVASISLLVGGVGIMNTMYTSVLERTKEIGVMKAVGATNPDVLKMFVIESGIIGLVGGSIGIVLGVAIAKGVEILAANAGFDILKALITPNLIGFGITFSLVIGIVSGLLPARRAARLDPVDAMRYE